MNATDWETRYQTGDMPWEKGEPAPGLVDFLAEHPELPRGRVAVPGCGTGHDVRTWARHGFEAWGFDLAPSAVRIASEKTREEGLSAQFRQLDFLRDNPPQPFDWLFEHTLFCAIDPAQRAEYIGAIDRWLAPGGQLLAIHYMIRDAQGPPFGCHQEELLELFSPKLELLRGWIPRSYPNRAGRELMLWWRKRP
jgi:SAM-dependent methyltransferase